MEPVRIGIVGVGWITQVVHLPLLQKTPEATVVALCDRDRSKVRLVAEKFGAQRSYTDIDAMLSAEHLDAILVATSTDAHRPVALAALSAGKHVLIEKPVARRYAEAVEIAAAARKSRKIAMVGMNHRFRPDVIALKNFLTSKELGKISYIRTGWLRHRSSDTSWLTRKEKSGGGVFLDLGIMMLDMALWLHGYPVVKRVKATTFHQQTKAVEDTALATLTLANGCAAMIEVSWTTHLEDDIYYAYVFGTEGTASLTPLRIIKELHGNLVNVAPAKMESPHTIFRRSYENELKHFLHAIQENRPVESSVDEAVERMRVVEAFYRSAKTEKEITLA